MKYVDKLIEKLEDKRIYTYLSGLYLLGIISWQSPKVFGKVSAQIYFRTEFQARSFLLCRI